MTFFKIFHGKKMKSLEVRNEKVSRFSIYLKSTIMVGLKIFTNLSLFFLQVSLETDFKFTQKSF
jgi:hypothetical protein